ncbi:DNA-binding protein [Terricaulis sp.]|uniref:DNA-binding protein n=1 Tax=Terricaulis sp. TaxID=2768686 RepID=UPI003784BCA7
MSLFFDADWFDAKLEERGLDRNALAASAGLDRTQLHAVYINERALEPAELRAFAALLGADLIEVSLKSGIAARPFEPAADPDARLANFEARLDAIDDWLNELERKRA